MLGPRKVSHGILGMNARNLLYIRPHNSRLAIKLADDKLQAKRVLRKAGISVPAVKGVVRNYDDLKIFPWAKLPSSFVLKPNQGLGGEGIMVVYGRNKKGNWVKADRSEVTIVDLKNHISNILEGNFSRTNDPDIAFFEERVKLPKIFKPFSFRGIPDIRIIVYNSVPVMAELRLPTELSGGRANLHVGGIGVGIDIAGGITTSAVHRGQLIEYMPNTRLLLSGIRIPFWNDILLLAIRSQEITRLGFMGVDIMIDREDGPMVAEVNARAGLAIQTANLSPLRDRLERVGGLAVKDAKHGIRLAKSLFGGEVEQSVEEMTGKKVLGVIEEVTITGKGDRAITLKAKIDTGAAYSSLDRKIAVGLGYSEALRAFRKWKIPSKIDKEKSQELEKQKEKYIAVHPDIIDAEVIRSSHGATFRPILRIPIEIAGEKLITKIAITDRRSLRYPMILGRRELDRFIVDPTKNRDPKSKF